MSRMASPPAIVPTLTDIVDVPSSNELAATFSSATTSLSRDLQKRVVRRVTRRITKTLKARLRKAGQQTSGESRHQLITDMCGEIENAVADAVFQAFVQQDVKAALPLKNLQIRAEKSQSTSSYKK